jgi:hypothetical protein
MSSPLPDDPLRRLQEDAVNFLLGNPATVAVPYASFRRQVITAKATEAQAAWRVRQTGLVGLACLVLMPCARLRYPNLPGPQFEIELTIRTFEDPKVNNTGLSAESVAVANYRWLDGLLVEDLTELYGDEKDNAVRPNYDYPGFLVYDSVLKGALPQDFIGRTPPPAIQDDDHGHVTLTCADPAAAIYYSTNGSLPTPGAPPDGNAATNRYTVPFAVQSGAIVRALAWNPALCPSHVAKGNIKY